MIQYRKLKNKGVIKMNLEHLSYEERKKYGDFRQVEVTDYKGNLKATVDTHDVAKSINSAQFGQLLEDKCNSFSCDYHDGQRIGIMLHSSHRTLQATIFRFLLGIIVGLGYQKYTDPRNETAVKCSKKIGEMIENGTLDIGYMI